MGKQTEHFFLLTVKCPVFPNMHVDAVDDNNAYKIIIIEQGTHDIHHPFNGVVRPLTSPKRYNSKT